MKKYILILLAFSPLLAFAYGPIGHYTIAQVAQEQLDCRANKRITKLLNNEPLAYVANWADNIKSDARYHWSNWHYCDIDAGVSRQAFDSISMLGQHGQVVSKVTYLVEYLKKNPNDTTMLKMLVHLVGDMHQPLHIGHAEDKGANDIHVKWFGQETNLHSVWDSKLIDAQHLSYTEYANFLLKMNPKHIRKQKFNKSMILDWAWQSYSLAQKIYETSETTKNTYRYIYVYTPVINKQLLDAGNHLAMILNYIYG